MYKCVTYTVSNTLKHISHIAEWHYENNLRVRSSWSNRKWVRCLWQTRLQ